MYQQRQHQHGSSSSAPSSVDAAWLPPFQPIRIRIRQFLASKQIITAEFVTIVSHHISDNNTYYLIHENVEKGGRFQFHIFLEQTPTLSSPDSTVIIIQFLNPHPSAWFRLTSETDIEKFLQHFERVLESAPPPLPPLLPAVPASAAGVLLTQNTAVSALLKDGPRPLMVKVLPRPSTGQDRPQPMMMFSSPYASRGTLTKKPRPMIQSAVIYLTDREEALGKRIREYFSTKQQMELQDFVRGEDGAVHIRHTTTTNTTEKRRRIPISFSVQGGGGAVVITFYGDKKLHFWGDDDDDDDDDDDASMTCIRQFSEGQIAFVSDDS